MKPHHFLLTYSIIFLSFLTSCSRDDEESPTPETVKQVQRISVVNTDDALQNEYRFQYNEDKTIKSIIKISSLISFTAQFEYDQNFLLAKIVPSQGDYFEVKIIYANGIINTILVDNQDIPISYNAVTETYEISGSELAFDADGDVDSLSGFLNLDYDETRKGAFYDIPSSNHQLMFLLLDELFLSTALSTKPVNSIDTGLENFNFSNTYDNQGYIISALSGSVSFEYQYFTINN